MKLMRGYNVDEWHIRMLSRAKEESGLGISRLVREALDFYFINVLGYEKVIDEKS